MAKAIKKLKVFVLVDWTAGLARFVTEERSDAADEKKLLTKWFPSRDYTVETVELKKK